MTFLSPELQHQQHQQQQQQQQPKEWQSESVHKRRNLRYKWTSEIQRNKSGQ